MQKEFETYKESIFKGKTRNIIIPIIFVIISIISFVLSMNFKSTEQVQNYMMINNMKFEYETFFIYISLGFLLCAILYIVVLYLKSSKRKFLLFENRVETTYRNKKETEILFTEITSIYKFRTFTKKTHAPYGILDCMAYKKDDGEFLVLKQHKNLIKKITERSIKENLDKTIRNIHNRKVIKFDYLNSKLNPKVDNLDKTLYNLCYKPLNKKAITIYKKTKKHFLILEKDGIIFGDEKIEFNVDDYFEVVNHILDDPNNIDMAGKIFFIKDKNNNIKLELDLIGLVNSDFFVELVTKIYDIKKGNSVIPTEIITENIEEQPKEISDEVISDEEILKMLEDELGLSDEKSEEVILEEKSEEVILKEISEEIILDEVKK